MLDGGIVSLRDVSCVASVNDRRQSHEIYANNLMTLSDATGGTGYFFWRRGGAFERNGKRIPYFQMEYSFGRRLLEEECTFRDLATHTHTHTHTHFNTHPRK